MKEVWTLTVEGKPTRSIVLTLAIVAAGAVALFIALANPAISDQGPSFGTIPDVVLDPSRDTEQNPISLDEMPDYLVVWDRDGNVAGYVRAEDAFGGDQGEGADPPWPVVGTELQLVGHLTPGGYVPVGESYSDSEVATTIAEMSGSE